MPKYELTQHQQDTMRRIRLALGKTDPRDNKALEDVTLCLITGFGPGTKAKANILNVRAVLLDDFSTTFESNEVIEVMHDNPAWKEEYKTNLTNARDTLNRVLQKMD